MTALPANRLDRLTGIRLIELRGYADDAGFFKRASTVLGMLPSSIGATAGDGKDVTVSCLSPDRWWIAGMQAKIGSLEARLRDTLRETPHSIVSLSPGLVSFRLKGPDAAAILAKGTALDLDTVSFPKGSARRTLHAGISTVIHRPGLDEPNGAFELHVSRSYHHYMRSWLLLAGKEYALIDGEKTE